MPSIEVEVEVEVCDPLHKQGSGGWPGWAPGVHQSYSNATGQTGVDPDREAKRTHPMLTPKEYAASSAKLMHM